MIRYLKRLIAQHKLTRDVERRRNSFEVQDYRKRREPAALIEAGKAALIRRYGAHV